ncbi:MAG: sigma-70 family RNA polymerase sigma factor [Acidobacteria bacterium]|nr:sigma-70 family RNA polymerase sigma factor [Acidobacteriota bacterium]
MKRKPNAEAANQFLESEDSALIAACLKGQARAWETLIYRYQRLIYSIPLKFRLSQDDAADIFQSVCLKLYEKLESLRDHERLSSWIITTTMRESWRLANRKKREVSADEDSDDETQSKINHLVAEAPLADEQRLALEQQQAVRQAIAALSERCQDLVTMLFYKKDDLSYAEIARQMDMPVASIGPTRARCLEKLKKLLEGKL